MIENPYITYLQRATKNSFVRSVISTKNPNQNSCQKPDFWLQKINWKQETGLGSVGAKLIGDWRSQVSQVFR